MTHTILKTLVLKAKLKIVLKIALCSLLFLLPTSAESKPVIIAITQIIDHPSLNHEREGLLSALKKAGYEEGKNLTIVYEDAQGSITTATQIATKFTGLNPDVVVAFSTPSAQTLVMPLSKKNIPLVFSAITDPLGSRIVTEMQERPEPITGVSDAMDISQQLDLIKKLIPDIETLGTIYNPGEANSAKAIGELTHAAQEAGLTLITAPASKTSEVKSAAQGLVGRTQALLILNDNTAVAAMPSIAAVGEENKLPIFAADTGSIEQGAAAGMVYDRRALGEKAGKMVIDILNGTLPGKIPVAVGHTPVLMINTKTASSQGLIVNRADYPKAIVIGEQS